MNKEPVLDYENMDWITKLYYIGLFNKENPGHRLLPDYTRTWLGYMSGETCVYCGQSIYDCHRFSCEDM